MYIQPYAVLSFDSLAMTNKNTQWRNKEHKMVNVTMQKKTQQKTTKKQQQQNKTKKEKEKKKKKRGGG